jgi:isoquinoline 1-oxidoreductase subunit beta
MKINSSSSSSSSKGKKLRLRLVATGAGGVIGIITLIIVGVKKLALPQIHLKLGKVIAPPGGPPTPPLPKSPFAWCRVDSGNYAHLSLPKGELGQGVHTALAQIIADELELDWNLIVIHGPATTQPFHPKLLAVFGSSSVNSLYLHLREMAAILREMLRSEAARQIGCSLEEIIAEQSHCYSRTNPTLRLPYSQLWPAIHAGQKGPAFPHPHPHPPKPHLKTPDQFRLIGKSLLRLDLPAKITGQAIYSYDVRLPGMLYGAVARPPRYGAHLRRVGRASIELARRQPGIKAVVVKRRFVGVVAERRSQAHQALGLLELYWTGGTRLNQKDIEATVTAVLGKGAVIDEAGQKQSWSDNPDREEQKVYQAEYRTSMVMAVPLEPPVAVADVRLNGTEEGVVVIYTATQDPRITRAAVARRLGRSITNKNKIEIRVTYAGGSFGRKHLIDAAVEAACLSAAVGKPVQVAWTMNEELRYGAKRPPTHHLLRAKLGINGEIVAIERITTASDATQSFSADGILTRLTGVDFIGAWGSHILYEGIPHRRVVYQRTPIKKIPTSAMRGVGATANVFASESFMDELAYLVGHNPLEFRLRHLAGSNSNSEMGQRLRRVLSLAAEQAGWETPPLAGRARGLACYVYIRTVMAQVAEVSIDEGGQIKVHRITCAVDAGRLVNPDGVRAQVEGGIMMGLSWALRERVEIENGMMANAKLDQDQYVLLRLSEAPEIDVSFIESDKASGGISEAFSVPVAPAVANAVFALTGQRLRELPLRLAPGVVAESNCSGSV